MALTINDTKVYAGLELIVSKFPNALVRSQVGCLSVPEALVTAFSGPELAALEDLDWYPDPVYGGLYFNVSGFVYTIPA